MGSFKRPETLQAAIQHHQAGRLPQAEALYREILGRDPTCVDAMHYLGVIAHQSGQPAAAVEWIGRAAALAPTDPTIHSNLGEAYRHLQRYDEAIECFNRALTLQPDHSDALNNLGSTLTVQGRLDEAVACFQRALAKAGSARTHYNLGMTFVARQEFEPAIAQFRQAVAFQPNFPAAQAALGSLFKLQGRVDEAIARYRQALALDSNDPETYYNLGVSLVAKGSVEEAQACFRRALSLNPRFAEAHNNLGTIFEECGQLDDAFASFQQALALNPRFAEAHCNIGNLAKRRGQLDHAIAAYERAVALNPALADAHNNLGVTYKDRGRFDEALASYWRAIELRPAFADAHNNLGNLMKEQGQVDEALACYRRALAVQPDRPDIHSNLVFALQYASDKPDVTDAELRLWNERHARPLVRFNSPHVNEPAPERRLRIGYVSPDFCRHAVGFNLVPLFERHAHDQFEIFCYSDVPRPDALTAQFRGWANQWREVASLSHVQLADLIRQDRIDVLVDLALHTANNRLPVFARKPAPLQISFAGYPGRTGLETIDAHLTDPYLTPVSAEIEPGPDAPIRLANTFWCYSPLATDPAVGPLPATTGGSVTFGCLNNLGKVNSAVLKLWCRVLSAVPNSRLILLSAEGRHRDRVLAEFAQTGVPANRVEFVGLQSRQNYLSTYHRIDLGLDTFPYNGHTTTLDAYWMGVPVVTLVGQTTVGRAGWSQLSNLRLTELAAHTQDEFVALATGLAGDLPRLAVLRADLRERMQRSPLLDPVNFTRSIEAAVRRGWRRWCTQAG